MKAPCFVRNLLHTPLQRGVVWTATGSQPFQRLSPLLVLGKPLKRFGPIAGLKITPLKRGVNQSSAA